MTAPALALVLLAALAPAARAADADAYFGRDRAALFDSYVAEIRAGQLLSDRGFARLGTTWERELQRSRRRFLSAVTRDDAYYAVLSLKNSLHDAHAGLNLPPGLAPYRLRLRIPLTLRPQRGADGRLRFVVAGGGAPGVEPGMVLEKFQGEEPSAALRDFREWEKSSSPEHEEYEFAAWLTSRNAAREPPPETRRASYVFRDPATGREVAAEAAFADEAGRSGEDPAPGAEDYAGRASVLDGENYRVYEDSATNALVLRYFSFGYDGRGGERDRGMKEDVARLASFLRGARPRFPRLLIDVRENGGGQVNQGLLELIARKPFRNTSRAIVFTPLARRDPEFLANVLKSVSPETGARLRRDLAAGRAESAPFAFECSTPDCSVPADVEAKPAAPDLGFETALLTGPYCVSSCDQFAATFADNGMGKVVGLPTQGGSAAFRGAARFRLANGESFFITLSAGRTLRPNGEELEGNPVVPDRVFSPRRDGLREALDALWRGRGAIE